MDNRQSGRTRPLYRSDDCVTQHQLTESLKPYVRYRQVERSRTSMSYSQDEEASAHRCLDSVG